MSTTVTYKGSTLTTVSNQTRTLKTAGKYMEGDVILTDSSPSIVVSETLDANGGIIKTITTTDEVNLQTKTITPTSSVQTVNPDTGYDGFSQVIVNAGGGGSPTLTTKTITVNGTYNASSDNADGYSSVTVNVPTGSTINNQNKSVTPTESQQSITADSGYTGLGTVTVNGIPFDYVGSGIDQLDSSDLTVSEATVTVPAGYYENGASKSVATMTLPTSAAASATSGYTSKATISRSTSDQYINIAPGYNSAGGYYKISAVANGSASGPTTVTSTAASISTGTNTLTLTKTGVTTTPTVSAGYVSSATASTATVTLTATVTTKAAATYYATTSDQTISASQYLTGAQTIKALSQTNLSAANIASGTTISINNGNTNVWSVTGTYTSDATAAATDIVSGETAYVNGRKVEGSLIVQNYYTGSSTPSSSLGNNGDIYFQS